MANERILEFSRGSMANELGFQRCLEFYIKLGSTALFLALVAAWAFFYRGRKWRLPPGPFPFPIIGNLHMIGELPHKALTGLALKYGPLMSLRLGSALAVVVSSPDLAKEFLKTQDLVFASRPQSTATKYLWYNSSDVTFSPYGRYWRQMRKVCVLQLLSSRRIDSFRFIREEEVSAMIRTILNSNPEQGSRPVNISKAVSALGIDMISRMAFGRKYSDQDLIGNRGINSMIKETFLLAGSFNIGDYIPYLAWMDLQGLNRRLKTIHKTQDELLEKIVEEHFSENKPNVPDLVDVLLAASADENLEFQIMRDNIKSVVYDILSAGSDASSTTIEWTISEVLRNPPVLKNLQDELERVVGLERMVQESDLPRLVYLQAVVKETLRLHPPATLSLPRLSLKACNVLGYEIPSGTVVLMNLWAIGRNPKSWGEDAKSFKPERFMEAGFLDARVQNFEWIPFGAGRRGCPGQQLGMIVAEFAVAQLFHCFNWKLLNDMNAQELDMSEKNHGLTISRAYELFAVPIPRLPVL